MSGEGDGCGDGGEEDESERAYVDVRWQLSALLSTDGENQAVLAGLRSSCGVGATGQTAPDQEPEQPGVRERVVKIPDEQIPTIVLVVTERRAGHDAPSAPTV
jgi:hypothetical protein